MTEEGRKYLSDISRAIRLIEEFVEGVEEKIEEGKKESAEKQSKILLLSINTKLTQFILHHLETPQSGFNSLAHLIRHI